MGSHPELPGVSGAVGSLRANGVAKQSFSAKTSNWELA